MSIVATEIESVHGDAHRMIFYRCRDHTGAWHPYGPVITADVGFDAEAHKIVVAAQVAESLADAEARQVID